MKLPTLTECFNQYFTDKGTIGHGAEAHNYGVVYEKYLEGFRENAINFCEIGVLKGNSLRAWRDYFQNATIVGIDWIVHPETLDQGYTILQGNQEFPESLSQLLKDYPYFEVILDDASHEAKHQQECLLELHSKVKPGGFYIIEDLHCPLHPYKPEHHWNTFKWEDRTDSTLDFFKNGMDKSYYLKSQDVKILRENLEIVELTSKVVILQKKV